jgi:cell wall-associated NlpC family hydrolase
VPSHQSFQLKPSMRGALAATAVVATVGITAAPAVADPLPNTASEAAKQVQDLSHQAEQLDQAVKKAEDDHAAKQADLDRANADAARAGQVATQARAEEAQFRGQVDAFTNASYQGARLNKLSALITSQTPSDFLNRASALDALAKDNNDAITKMSAAVTQANSADKQAQDARGRATQAEADAARIQGDLQQKQSALQVQIGQLQARYNQLNAADQAALNGGGQTDYQAPAGTGAASAAVQAALSRQGDPYVWGATGPNSFDCSGLTMWSYQQAGVTIGRSTYSQVTDGRSVSASELQPGDLIFYYSDNSHVAMYVGNGMAVHAPTEGETVKTAPYQNIGQVNAIRRIVG